MNLDRNTTRWQPLREFIADTAPLWKLLILFAVLAFAAWADAWRTRSVREQSVQECVCTETKP